MTVLSWRPHRAVSAEPRAASDPTVRVMGIVNVTADSFSDGGEYLDRDRAVQQGLRLLAEGAHIIDVGGESTRPGALRVDPRVERERVVPVIAALTEAGAVVSVDTMRAETAAAAVDAGASFVNDVSGGRADTRMAKVAAQRGVRLILGHWRTPDDVHRVGDFARRNVVREVRADLSRQVRNMTDAGVDPEMIVLDPGLGFAKSATDNWALLRALPELLAVGFPILLGASRKRFLGTLLGDSAGDRPPRHRDVATAVVSALAAGHGVWGVRVHDVRASADALAVAAAWRGTPTDDTLTCGPDHRGEQTCRR